MELSTTLNAVRPMGLMAALKRAPVKALSPFSPGNIGYGAYTLGNAANNQVWRNPNYFAGSIDPDFALPAAIAKQAQSPAQPAPPDPVGEAVMATLRKMFPPGFGQASAATPAKPTAAPAPAAAPAVAPAQTPPNQIPTAAPPAPQMNVPLPQPRPDPSTPLPQPRPPIIGDPLSLAPTNPGPSSPFSGAGFGAGDGFGSPANMGQGSTIGDGLFNGANSANNNALVQSILKLMGK